MSAPGQPKHPAKTPEPRWEVVDNKTFWRSVKYTARKNGFAVVTGFTGGPLVIYASRPSPTSEASLPPNPEAGLSPGWVDMRTAAKRLGGHHPCWLSRKKKWRTLGLRPRKSGKTYMFHEDDIAAAITRLPAAGARGGRRRKIIGVIHAQG